MPELDEFDRMLPRKTLFGKPRVRDLEATFGDLKHTLVLLLVYILGFGRSRDIARLEKYSKNEGALARFYMLASQGIFNVSHERDKTTIRAAFDTFRFNNDEPLAPYVVAVLAVIDKYLPKIREMAEIGVNQPIQQTLKRTHRRRRRNMSEHELRIMSLCRVPVILRAVDVVSDDVPGPKPFAMTSPRTWEKSAHRRSWDLAEPSIGNR